MIRLFFILFFFAIPLSSIFSQKKHTITLSANKIVLPNNNFYVTEVLDRRANKENIGVVQKGLNNKKVIAVFSEPTTIHLKNMLNWMLSSTSKESISLVVGIRKLYISEKTTAWKEYGISEVSLEFLTPDSLSYGIFHARLEYTGMDVTEKHPQRIRLALEDCLRQFSNSKKEPTKRLVLNNAPVKPIHESTTLNEGVYHTFSDFQNNQPSENIKFALQIKKGKIERFKLFAKGSNEPIRLEIFGVCQNNEIYLASNNYTIENYFVKAQLKGKYLYFEDKFTPNPATTTAAFGLVGYYTLKRKTGIVLDTTTGLVQILNGKSMSQLLQSYPDLLEKYERSNHSLSTKKVFLHHLNKILKEAEKQKY